MTLLAWFQAELSGAMPGMSTIVRSIQWPVLWQSLAGAVTGGLGMYFGIGGLLEYLYYRRRRAEATEWKCQPKRWLSAKMRREELLMGATNMSLASIATGLLIYHLKTGGSSGIYYDFSTYGPLTSLLLTVVYFLATDCGLYWAHRIFHRPALFRWIHRHHHRFTAPTAFTATAMHPIELFTYQSIMIAPLLFYPIHVAGIIAVLVYQNYVALVDHSGIKLYSFWPWQPATQFHDDHHVYFHVNYGQNLGVWDWMFGTWRRKGRRYGIEVFGGKGAAVEHSAEVAHERIDYGRKPSKPGESLEPQGYPGTEGTARAAVQPGGPTT